MPAAIVTLAATAYSAYSKNKAAGQARDAQNKASQQGIGAYNQARSDLQPYQAFGQGAIPLLERLNNGDYSGFLDSPDYKAAYSQGIGALDSSAASRGSLFSGGHEKDLAQFGSGLASQALGQYRSGLMSQLSGGQSAAAGQGSYAGGIAGLYGQQGQANANAALTRGDNNAQLAGVLGNSFGDWYAGRSTSSYAPQPNSTSPFNPGYAADYNSSIFGKRY